MAEISYYLVRLFDARPRSATSGTVCWVKSPADERVFARMRERAWRFTNRRQAELAADRLPRLYEPKVELAPS